MLARLARKYLLAPLVWLLFKGFTIPSWAMLKVIGGSYFSTLTVIIPLIGYLMFFGRFTNGTYTLNLRSFGELEITTVGGFEFIRMKMTYVGLSIIGFATIIYKIVCPEEIKNYKDQRDYIEQSIAVSFPASAQSALTFAQSRFWYSFAVSEIETASTIQFIENITSDAGKARGSTPLRHTDWLERNQGSLNAIMSMKYSIKNYSLLLVRGCIFTAYTAGFILLLLPSVQIFLMTLKEVTAYLQMEYLVPYSGNNSP